MGNRSPSSTTPQTAHDLRLHAKRCTSLPQHGLHVREKFETSNKKTYSFSTTPWKIHMQPKHGGGLKMTFRLSIGGFWGSMLIFRGVDFSEFRPLQNNMAPNSDGTSDLHRRCWVTEEMQQKTSVKHISQPFHSPQQEPSTRKKVFFTPSIYHTKITT